MKKLFTMMFIIVLMSQLQWGGPVSDKMRKKKEKIYIGVLPFSVNVFDRQKLHNEISKIKKALLKALKMKFSDGNIFAAGKAISYYAVDGPTVTINPVKKNKTLDQLESLCKDNSCDVIVFGHFEEEDRLIVKIRYYLAGSMKIHSEFFEIDAERMKLSQLQREAAQLIQKIISKLAQATTGSHSETEHVKTKKPPNLPAKTTPKSSEYQDKTSKGNQGFDDSPPEKDKKAAPTIVLSYLKCKAKTIEDDQTVDSPVIQVNAIALDTRYHLKKIVILINNRTIYTKKISGTDYRLKQKITLKDKINRIQLIAYNKMGLRAFTRVIKLTWRKEVLKGLSLREFIKYIFGTSSSWAVVIGIDDYSKKKNGYKPLPYAVNDAVAVRKCLINSLGFTEDKVISLYDQQATKKRIDQLLGVELPKKIGKNDRVIIYFSGHGDQEDNGKFGYLIPVDGKKDSLYSTSISMRQLYDFSQMIRARQILFILDSCFSGVAGRVYKKGGDKKIPKETRKQIEAFIRSKGRQIMTAGTANEPVTMSEEWNDHSVYTYYLLRGLVGEPGGKAEADYDNNTIVSVRELQVYLDSKVPKESKQTPQLFNLNNSEGQFVFYREDEY